MRIAIVGTWAGGAVHNISYPIYEWLRDNDEENKYEYLTVRGIELDPTFDTSFDGFDLVHFTYFANIQRYIQEIEVPFTCMAHHLGAGREDLYSTQLHEWGPERIFVPESFIQRQLGARGVQGVVRIPYAFDHGEFKPTPLPEEFVVGFLGCDSSAKRFDVIRKACKKAGVRYLDFDRKTRNEEIDFMEQEEILDFYEDIACYVVASWTDGGPLPPQEALLCGRPVITTPVGMMPDLHNKYVKFFDGSVGDLADKLGQAKAWHRGLQMQDAIAVPTAISEKAKHVLPKVEDVAKMWKREFEAVEKELA